MKFNFKHAKLKNQLLALIFIAIAVMILIESFYYIYISGVIRKRAEIYVNNILSQFTEKIDYTTQQLTQAADIITYNKYIQQLLKEEDVSVKLEYTQYVSDMISYINTSNQNINNIILFDNQGLNAYNNAANFSIFDQIESTYKIYNKNSYIDTYTGLLEDNLTGKINYYYAYIRTVFWSLENTQPNDKIGTCMLLCNVNPLIQSLNKLSMTPSSTFLVLDSQNKVIACNNNRFKTGETKIGDIQKLFMNSSKTTIKDFYGKNSLIQYKNIEKTGWKIISIIPISEIDDDLKPVLNYGLIIVAFTSIIFVILGFALYYNITRPITNIIGFMNKGGYHSLHKRLEVNEKNEIGQISINVNIMLDEIEEMTRNSISNQSRLYEFELAKKQAELSALQSQINPHFLYNTLDCIKGIGYSVKSQDIVSVTSSLSFIMRYSIKGGDIVSVKNEIECVQNYLKIISIRFQNKHDFQLDIDERLMDMKINKFILQPIVENAIYHGLEPKLTGGLLKIKGQLLDNQQIYFEIFDNGKGMTYEELERLNQLLKEDNVQSVITDNKDRSIGMININSRIKFRYGKEFGLKIFSREDEGTTIILSFPCIDI
jgi:two-component system, sensor histidine kinase YesM